MKTFFYIRSLLILSVLQLTLSGSNSSGDDLVQFNRDVRPILSNNCF